MEILDPLFRLVLRASKKILVWTEIPLEVFSYLNILGHQSSQALAAQPVQVRAALIFLEGGGNLQDVI